MPYKSVILIVFSVLFFTAPSYAAIPLDQSPEQKEDKLGQKLMKKIEKKWVKKLAPDEKPRNENINGLLSLIFGAASLVLFPPLAIPAVILGIISLNKKEPAQWMAIVGLITGSLLLLIAIALLVIFLIVLA